MTEAFAFNSDAFAAEIFDTEIVVLDLIDGTYYALMTLGLEEFKNSVQQANGIEEPLRQAVLQAAGKAFSAHDDEMSRY